MEPLYETVFTKQPVDSRIADLVYFAKYIQQHYGSRASTVSTEDLIVAAKLFWDMQHGED